MSPVKTMRHEVLYGNRIVPCFIDRPPTVDSAFRRTVARHGESVAIVEGETRISYAELDVMIDRLAAGLIRAGLLKGERIGLLLGNQVEFIVAFLAAGRAGLISVPLNTRQRAPEISLVLGQCGAAAVITSAEYSANLPPREALPTVHSIFVAQGERGCFSGLTPSSEEDAEGRVRLPELWQEDTLCLLYTSGTTGAPKGAMLTHVSIIHSLIHFQQGFDLQAGEVAVLAVPVSHVTGLVAVVLTTLYVGGTVVMLKEFKAPQFLALAEKQRMTYTIMVPAMYNLCLLDPGFSSCDLTSWRIGGFGGAPMPEATIDRLRQALPALCLYNAYGATETSSPVTLTPSGGVKGNAGSVGCVLPLADVVIVDDQGREVAPGQSGELLIGGPMVIPAYWDNPAANAEAFVMGYWVSGDIGYRTEDGFVWIHDRKKDLINRGGYKIYCPEVENVLLTHPAIIEAAVVGYPDTVLGERVHAFIFCRHTPPSAQELQDYCSKRISDYKVPETFTFLSAGLPRNANGKVMKNSLRQQLREQAPARRAEAPPIHATAREA